MKFFNAFVIIGLVNVQICTIEAQRSILDLSLFRFARRSLYNLIQGSQNIEFSKMKLQPEYPETAPFFCNLVDSPGKRSMNRPTSIHKLRPGDVDIIAAMGDSLTAGNGIAATSRKDVFVENRGLSWSIGGQDNWRKFLTLPNILKQFNPSLYGYSLRSGLATDRSSKFNVAEPGAMSRDMPYQAKVLVQRLKHDPKVNMTEHWKLLTFMIGANDFCSDLCFRFNPQSAADQHARTLLKTLRYLRDQIPRLMVNIIPAPDVRRLFELTSISCGVSQLLLCSCFGGKSPEAKSFYGDILEDWYRKEEEITERDEFNTESFTVNFQPFSRNFNIPRLPNGEIDYSYMSADCFHLSQKSQSEVSLALWNNMLEPVGSKTRKYVIGSPIKCPTKTASYLYTRQNSG